MEKNPKVSVIIPTYNSAQFIAEALESVFVQTYKDYEVIVVDDGSTDNTKEVLKPYMSKIRYIYKENGGAASARNVGIKNARGEYIAFLDSDDLWLPEKLEKQMGYFEEHPQVDMVFANCVRFSEEVSNTRNDIRQLVSDDMFVNIWWYNIIPTSTVIVKRECFKKVGFFDESRELETTEDKEMWLRIAREYKIGHLDEVLTKYRVRFSGYNRSNIDRAYNSTKLVINKYWRYLERRGYSIKFLHQRLHRHYFNYGLSHLHVGNVQDAHKQFEKAIKYNPLNFKTIVYYLVTFLNYRQVELIRKIKLVIFLRRY